MKSASSKRCPWTRLLPTSFRQGCEAAPTGGNAELRREGDTVFCHSMDRLARNLDDLRRIVLGLTELGVHIVFVKENLTFTGEDSPHVESVAEGHGAFAQLERADPRAPA